MPVSANHSSGQPITAADINALAALANANETAIAGVSGGASGAAGGGLSGTYPNPTVVVVAAGTAGPLSATDASTTNSRTPTAHAASHAPAGSDDLTTALSATAVPVALGTAALGSGTGFARSGHVHPTTGLLLAANNLSDVTAATARTNLGLGSAAAQPSSAFDASGAAATAQAAAKTAADGTYPTVVEHGSTAGTARPAGALRVFWRGSVAPTNATQYDRWVDTSTTPYTERVYNGSAFTTFASSSSNALAINAQTGTTYTFILTDATVATLVELTNAAAVTATIPPESSVAWPSGSVLLIGQGGTGQVTVAAGAGVTLRTPNGAKAATQFSQLSATKRATNDWIISGDTAT